MNITIYKSNNKNYHTKNQEEYLCQSRGILMSILHGCCIEILKTLEEKSVHSCVTSPPYFGLRDYGVKGQIGLEITPEEYVSKILEVFSEVKRVLRDDGTLWLNLGDSYAQNQSAGDRVTKYSPKQKTSKGTYSSEVKCPVGYKVKDLIGIPWMVAFALRSDGWYLRQDIIWHKPNPMPESVTDRCTKSHEYIFLLSKSPKYHFDHEAIKEKGVMSKGDSAELEEKGYNTRNKRSVWIVNTKPFKEAHFATFPIDLIEPCILASCPENGTVLDPFFGAGTTGIVCIKNKRNYIGIELNQDYIDIAKKRISDFTTREHFIKF
jgi:DNA modification methylase